MAEFNPWRGMAGRDITKADPGVISTRGDANAARDKAGKDALAEPSSEFEHQIPADLQGCFDRLVELREEMGELYNEMYATQTMGAMAPPGRFSGPPAHVKLAIQACLDAYEEEEMMIQARIMELQYALPPHDYRESDHGEDEAAESQGELSDPTQPGRYMPGPAKGSATKAIGWPDQGR